MLSMSDLWCLKYFKITIIDGFYKDMHILHFIIVYHNNSYISKIVVYTTSEYNILYTTQQRNVLRISSYEPNIFRKKCEFIIVRNFFWHVLLESWRDLTFHSAFINKLHIPQEILLIPLERQVANVQPYDFSNFQPFQKLFRKCHRDVVHLECFHFHLYVFSRVWVSCMVLQMFDGNVGIRICPELLLRPDISFGRNI